MKRFMAIIALFSISILAIWTIFVVFAASPLETKSDNPPIKVHDETDELLKANQLGDLIVPVTISDMKIAPVFDSTGTLVSDPTGTMLNANKSGDLVVQVTGTAMKIAPVFDSTGTLVSDPTGTMLSVINP